MKKLAYDDEYNFDNEVSSAAGSESRVWGWGSRV